MPGSLKVDKVLARKDKDEDTGVQVARIMKHLREKLLKDPNKNIGLIYAANDEQAKLFHQAYSSSSPSSPVNLPQVKGSGQAILFDALIVEINKDLNLKKRVRVLPFATSISGGENGPGNIASQEIIKRDLKAIQQHMKDGYDVLGIQGPHGYAIGGEASKHWFTKDHAAFLYKDALYSQGQFVQEQLAALEQDPNLDLDKIFDNAQFLIGQQLSQAKMKTPTTPPAFVTSDAHNLTGSRKKDWEDIIDNYNTRYNKEILKSSSKLEFDSVKDATNFMKEQANDRKKFTCQLANPEGVKQDYYLFSRGNGKLYEGNAQKITQDLSKDLLSNPSLEEKMEIVKDILKFEGRTSKISTQYKTLEAQLKGMEQEFEEKQKKGSSSIDSPDPDPDPDNHSTHSFN